jgi:hypothetical protein
MRNSLLTIVFLFAASSTCEATCTFSKWSTYLGSPLLRHEQTSAYVFATLHVKVDADGAPNAYHPADVGLHCTKGSGFKGLDCPANAGYPSSKWWPSALVPNPTNPKEAFVQLESAEFPGFFVSKTSLQDKSKALTDPTRYVDSRRVPYLVFPGHFHSMAGTGDMGDLGYAVNLANGKASAFVVAEVGPSDAKLGEMSIALAIALGGTDPNPRTGAGVPEGKVMYVVFPKSRESLSWPLSTEQIGAKTQELLKPIGGIEAAVSCKDAF